MRRAVSGGPKAAGEQQKAGAPCSIQAMERPRFTELKPDGSYNRSKDIVERLLLDSMADEVFVLQSVKGKVDEEAYAAVQRALDNIAARSRHIGQELCRVLKSQRSATPRPSELKETESSRNGLRAIRDCAATS